MKRPRFTCALLGFALVALFGTDPAAADQNDAPDEIVVDGSPTAGAQINWQVISGGAMSGASTSYQLSGTVGQAAIGTASSSDFELNQGYWQVFGSGGCCQLRGDVDTSGTINVSDLTYLVALLFQGGPQPACADEGDVDGSGVINVSDLTYLVASLFQGGPPPPAC